MIIEKIVYFESGGRHNTDDALRLSRERAVERGIKNIVLASITGFSAERALDIFKDVGVKLTVVSLRGPSGSPFSGFPETTRLRLLKEGHNFCYATDIKYYFPEDVQRALCRFCEGLKVCVEVTLVATDAGFLKPGEEIIALGGTGRLGYERGGGLDTAVVMESIGSKDFLNLETIFGKKEERRKIKEIICKPR